MKKNPKTRYYVTLLILIHALNTMSQEREWERIALFDDANTVFSLMQDAQGLIWFGTSQGLYDFDGYSCHPHFQVGEVSNSHIYCGVEIGKKLYLGSELGVLIYDVEKDEYLPFDPIFPLEVRTLAVDDHKLWIGTLNGLYCYDLISNTMLQIADGIPHQAIYALIQTVQGDLFIGTYNGLCLRSRSTGRTEQIPLPHIPGRNNIFVNSLVEDNRGENIWIGVEGALYQYHIKSKHVEEIPALAGNSVKSLAINDHDDIIVGTDNGLYIHGNGITSRYNHDSRYPKSLSNDVIWSVLVDKDNNIWAGTEYDVSLAIDNQVMEIISIGHLTGRGDGNRFFTIFRDSRDNLWLGGSNGIIRYHDGHSRWYMMGDPENTISHNRIRDIYEDSKGNLWVATDGSINRYNYEREQFVTFGIIDESGHFNANWAYKILEDANHNLWIGSYLGGVHVIQNERTFSPNKEIIADKAYNSTNGFPSNLINQIIIDKNEDKWILFYKDGHLLKIENKTDKIQMYDLKQQLDVLPMFLITDAQDRLWCGFQGGIALLDKAGRVVKKLSFSEKGNENIKDIERVGSNLWVATSREVWLVNTDDATRRMLPLPNRIFTAIYHDQDQDKVILGSVDEIIRVTPSIAYEKREARPLCVTAISVNDNVYRSGITPRLLNKLHLNHTQKRVVIQFSDLNYALHSKPRYEYRLIGMQTQWNILPENQNLITLSNLKPGKYTLQIRPVNITAELFTFNIDMAQPWFNTGWAWISYLILTVTLIWGITHYSRLQQRLRKERTEKEEQLEAARETIRNMVSINGISTLKPLELLSVDEKMLAEVAQVVEKNIANPDLNVNYVCDKTGISTKQLYRKIKQYLGITPVEFIRQIRLRKAAQLLEQKKFTVSEVMYMVGFSSPGYFSKCFATQFGCTPRSFLERPEC